VLQLVERKGIPVHVIDGPVKAKAARRKKEPEVPSTRGLPD
jgi:hypothetical protein